MNEGKIILGLIDKLKERSQSKNGKYGNTFLMGGGGVKTVAFRGRKRNCHVKNHLEDQLGLLESTCVCLQVSGGL